MTHQTKVSHFLSFSWLGISENQHCPRFLPETLQTNARQRKALLKKSPPLALPDFDKLFYLWVHERQGIAVAVLIQMLRPLKRTRPYFSKRWDTVAKGSCSSHMPLDKRSKKSPNKKTMSQPMPIWTPHQASRVFLETWGQLWLSQNKMLQHRAVLIDTPRYSCHSTPPIMKHLTKFTLAAKLSRENLCAMRRKSGWYMAAVLWEMG